MAQKTQKTHKTLDQREKELTQKLETIKIRRQINELRGKLKK